MTFFPSFLKPWASLAMLVVLPHPFTPTTRMSWRLPNAGTPPTPASTLSRFTISSFKAECICEPSLNLSSLARCFILSISLCVVATPTSAEISNSSSSSQVSSSTVVRSKRRAILPNQISRLRFTPCSVLSVELDIPARSHKSELY
ncbi:hypothetical protein ES703_56790 [subsurface metagenome]